MLQFLPRLPGDEPGDPGRTMIKTDILFHLISPFLKTCKAQGAIQVHQAGRDVRFLFAMTDYSFYDSAAWKRKRAQVLRRDKYMCQDCKRYGRMREAVEVHHIQHLEDAPELALDASNLVSLCKACHRKRHPEKGGTHTR